MTTKERIEELKAELTKLEKQHEMEQLAQQLAAHGAELQAYASFGGYHDDCHNRAKLLIEAASKPMGLYMEWNVNGEMIEFADGPALRDTGISLLIPKGYPVSKQELIGALRDMLKFAEQPPTPKPLAEGDPLPF